MAGIVNILDSIQKVQKFIHCTIGGLPYRQLSNASCRTAFIELEQTTYCSQCGTFPSCWVGRFGPAVFALVIPFVLIRHFIICSADPMSALGRMSFERRSSSPIAPQMHSSSGSVMQSPQFSVGNGF
jgi:hypothetical protein